MVLRVEDEENQRRVIDGAPAWTDVVSRALSGDARGHVERNSGRYRKQRREPPWVARDVLAVDSVDIAEAEPFVGTAHADHREF